VAVGDADEEAVDVVPDFTIVAAEGVVIGTTELADVMVEDLVDDVAEESEEGTGEELAVVLLGVDGAVVEVDVKNADVEAPPNVAREASALEPEAAPTPVEWTVSSQLPPHVSLVSPRRQSCSSRRL
jgi:hypothetical protein